MSAIFIIYVYNYTYIFAANNTAKQTAALFLILTRITAMYSFCNTGKEHLLLRFSDFWYYCDIVTALCQCCTQNNTVKVCMKPDIESTFNFVTNEARTQIHGVSWFWFVNGEWQFYSSIVIYVSGYILSKLYINLNCNDRHICHIKLDCVELVEFTRETN